MSPFVIVSVSSEQHFSGLAIGAAAILPLISENDGSFRDQLINHPEDSIGFHSSSSIAYLILYYLKDRIHVDHQKEVTDRTDIMTKGDISDKRHSACIIVIRTRLPDKRTKGDIRVVGHLPANTRMQSGNAMAISCKLALIVIGIGV